MEENGIRKRFLRNLAPVVQNMHLLKSALSLSWSQWESVMGVTARLYGFLMH